MIGAMKAPIVSSAIVIVLLLGALNAVYADSAIWNANPIDSDWSNPANWTPATVPNGPSDTATFASSGVTDVSISALVQLDGIVFDVGADAFTISNTPIVVLTISGAGITNNSGVLQNFVNQQNLRSAGQLYFTNGATAGDSVIYTNQTAERSGTIFPLIQFEDNSTAGTAQFINMAGGGFSRAGVIEFQGNSTAGNGTFQNTGVSGQNSPEINFRDQASAGEAVMTNEESTSSFVTFYDNSTADHATITNEAHFGGGFVFFYNNSTAANATIINEGDTTWNGYTYFYDTSTAGDGLFIVDGSLTTSFGYGILGLTANSSAGNGTFIANGGQVAGAAGGHIYVQNFASAENGTFYANGTTVEGAFGGRVTFTIQSPTAATATLIGTGGVGTGEGAGGGIVFLDSSVGAAPRVEVFGNGFFDIRAHDTRRLTIGSLEGDGLVFLGGLNLSIGSNNLSTEFSGLIEENSEGTIGALTKIGQGILTLSSENTYTGGTTIASGKLVIANQSGSGTGTGPVNVTRGKLGGTGIIAGATTIGTGNGTGAFLAPAAATGTSQQAILTIQSALTFNADATCSCTFKAEQHRDTTRTKTSMVIANGVTINSGATIELVGHITGALSQGTPLTLISNTSVNPISGTFGNLPDGGIITINGNNFQASYEGGDGNDLTLTVVP